MSSKISSPSPYWRAMTNNFSYLSKDIGGILFRNYARRQCLIGIDGMLSMSDETLADYGTTRVALTKLRARLASGSFPPQGAATARDAA